VRMSEVRYGIALIIFILLVIYSAITIIYSIRGIINSLQMKEVECENE